MSSSNAESPGVAGVKLAFDIATFPVWFMQKLVVYSLTSFIGTISATIRMAIENAVALLFTVAGLWFRLLTAIGEAILDALSLCVIGWLLPLEIASDFFRRTREGLEDRLRIRSRRGDLAHIRTLEAEISRLQAAQQLQLSHDTERIQTLEREIASLRQQLVDEQRKVEFEEAKARLAKLASKSKALRTLRAAVPSGGRRGSFTERAAPAASAARPRWHSPGSSPVATRGHRIAEELREDTAVSKRPSEKGKEPLTEPLPREPVAAALRRNGETVAEVRVDAGTADTRPLARTIGAGTGPEISVEYGNEAKLEGALSEMAIEASVEESAAMRSPAMLKRRMSLTEVAESEKRQGENDVIFTIEIVLFVILAYVLATGFGEDPSRLDRPSL